MIVKIIEAPTKTDVGAFIESVYTDGKDTAICLSVGEINHADRLYVRIHSHCISSHVFFYNGCDCREQMRRSQERIAELGTGIIIWLDQEGRSNGHIAKMASEYWKSRGLTQTDAYIAAGYKGDARDYSLAVKIIKHINPISVVILTNNPDKIAAIHELGIPISAEPI